MFDVARRHCDALESCGAIGNGLHEFVSRRERGVSDRLVLKRDSVTEVCTVGSLDVTLVHAVVLGRGADVPAIDGVEGPSATGIGLLVDLDLAPHGGERHLVIVKRPIEVNIGRDGWNGIGLVQEIGGDLCFWQELVPHLGWEVVGNTSKDAEEMRLEIPDGNLGCICGDDSPAVQVHKSSCICR